MDDKRIYATAHSNGGGFTYLLWAARGERFAAFAPSGSAAPRLLTRFKPKPVLVRSKNSNWSIHKDLQDGRKVARGLEHWFTFAR